MHSSIWNSIHFARHFGVETPEKPYYKACSKPAICTSKLHLNLKYYKNSNESCTILFLGSFAKVSYFWGRFFCFHGQNKYKIRLCTLHRGAFCQLPFRWIYYCHSSKSTGKETGKMHLCAAGWQIWQFELSQLCYLEIIWSKLWI